MAWRAVAGLAVRAAMISRLQRLAVNAQLVLLRLFLGSAFPAQEMAASAVHLQYLAVRIRRHSDMAFGAVEMAVHGLLKGCLVDVSLHAFLTMTGVTIVLCISGRGNE